MKRKEFISKSTAGCLGLVMGSTLLPSCLATKMVSAELQDGVVTLPVSAFAVEGRDDLRRYITVKVKGLDYPLVVYRESNHKYHTLLLKCTHQGTELRVYGDLISCPAHGSEFSNRGEVFNGPAKEGLTTFETRANGQAININITSA